jgi:hypothetical protein
LIIEDDAQGGGDHVDAHRSVAYIVGPYVKQGAVVSAAYNTVSLISTIEDILGLEPLELTDALAAPMSEVFEETLRPWTYTALVTEVPAHHRVTAATTHGKQQPALDRGSIRAREAPA